MVFNEFKELESVLNNLDEIVIDGIPYKPKFMYGSHTDMLNYLNQKRSYGENTYPLIWLETPVQGVLDKPNYKLEGANFILATLTTIDLSNTERTRITFDTILDKLLDNVLRALDGNTISVDLLDRISIKRHFNYQTDGSKGSSDIWDAIQLRISLNINLNCLTK